MELSAASQRNPVQTYMQIMKVLDLYLEHVSYTDNVVNSSDVLTSVSRHPWPYRLRTRLIYNGINPPSLDNWDRLPRGNDIN